MTLSIREANASDADLLAELNDQLVQDMGYENPLTRAETRERMTAWLEGTSWSVVVFEESEPVGYAVYRSLPDTYDPQQRVVFLRQFFIRRSQRHLGLGSRCFEALCRRHFPQDQAVVVHVMERNQGAQSFWRRLGFAADYTVMRRPSASPAGE